MPSSIYNICKQLALTFALTFALTLAPTLNATAQRGPSEGFSDNVESQAQRFAYAGHHALFDSEGRRIDPSLEELYAWITETLEAERAETGDEMRDRLQEIEERARVELQVDDTIMASLLLEWLVFADKRPNRVYIQALNRTVREHWYKKLLGRDELIESFDYVTGLPRDLGATAQTLNLIPTVSGDQTGKPYMRTCEDAGVPEPATWSRKSGDWQKEGDLLRNFLNFGKFTEVWTFEKDDPDGICVALPRFDDDPAGNEEAMASAVGIICLGRNTGNACFYDTGAIRANQEREIIDFVSGSTLSNGVCSDCHAGENPYIVHTFGPLDMGARIRSPVWHNPIIRSDWPQNPGPLTLINDVDLLPNENSCLECHNAGIAGRFPDVLALTEHARQMPDAPPTAIAGYCTAVLKNAISGYVSSFTGEQIAPTMVRIKDEEEPDNILKGTPDPTYERHRKAMLAFCQQEPYPTPANVPVDDQDDPEVVSPPVLGPLYACAEAIEVRGAIYDAEIVLSINGTDLPPVVAKKPNGFSIAVPPLAVDDEVVASQTFDGVTAKSEVYKVISHLEHYPDGLPRPRIDPTEVHQCGRVIAVRHAAGAFVTILTNGSQPVTYSSGGDWTNMRPGKSPFELDDTFVAEQRICEDRSDPSAMVDTGPEPSPLPTPMLDGSSPIAGQPFLHIRNLPEGAASSVAENSTGEVAKFETAVTWNPEVNVATGLGRLIQPGDAFVVDSQLCEAVSVEIDTAEPCEALPAPVIAQPFVGDTSISVTNYVAGARIQVFDTGFVEIADGSGSEVGLTRALVRGDILTVVQRLDRCVSREGYQVAVVCASLEDCDLE